MRSKKRASWMRSNLATHRLAVRLGFRAVVSGCYIVLCKQTLNPKPLRTLNPDEGGMRALRRFLVGGHTDFILGGPWDFVRNPKTLKPKRNRLRNLLKNPFSY